MSVDQQLSDLMADGRITEGDVYEVQTFRRFLAARVPRRPQTPEDKALYRAWLPYMTGQGDPPPIDGAASPSPRGGGPA